MKISVLMSIYQKESPANLRRALNSLVQQNLRADEVVLVEDGPLPFELLAVIDYFRDDLNIKSIRLSHNLGLAAALNEGLKHCSYPLVARMDSDDVSLSTRFMRQVDFMCKNLDVAVSSAFIEEVDSFGKIRGYRSLPLLHEEIFSLAKKRSPICHAAAIFRKQAVITVGGYPPFRKGQDYALWARMLVNNYRFANIDEPLYRVEVNDDFFERRGIEHLRNELAILTYQKNIGFLTTYEYMRNCIMRIVGRLSPIILKRIIYRYFWVR